MTTWIVVGLVGLGSYAMRLVPLLRFRGRPSALARRALGPAPPAALAALVASTLVAQGAQVSLGSRLLPVPAVVVCLWLASRGRPQIIVVAGGFATYWTLTAALAVVS